VCKIASDFDKTDSVMGIFLYQKYDFFVGDIFSYDKNFLLYKKDKNPRKINGCGVFCVL
jgi:hypothetical protein